MAYYQNSSQQEETRKTDYTTALALSNTREIIADQFVLDLCGLKRIQKLNGDFEIVRWSRPRFTYDFAQDLMGVVYIISNIVTARTKFSEQQINKYMIKQTQTLSRYLATLGVKNLISDKAWKYIIDLDKPNLEAVPNDKGEFPNYWMTDYGINWSYARPVNSDMLNLIKARHKTENLESESFAQDIILQQVCNALLIFIHGSLNRSEGALTLEFESKVVKESIQTSAMETGSPVREGTIKRVMDWVGKLGHGKTNQEFVE